MDIKINGQRGSVTLWPRDTLQKQEEVQLADKQIDTSNYTKEELIAKLEELSTTEIVT